MEEASRIDLYNDFGRINAIDPALYEHFDVKRGLRNADGTGVVAGITNISNVHGYLISDGEKIPDEGHLSYRGYDIYDLLGDESSAHRFIDRTGGRTSVIVYTAGQLPDFFHIIPICNYTMFHRIFECE